MGCVLGTAAAAGLLLIGSFVACAGFSGGCAWLTGRAIEQSRERIEKEKHESLHAPRAVALREKAQVEHVAVEIIGVKVGRVALDGLSRGAASEDKTAVTIRVSVTDPNRKYDYSPWSNASSFSAKPQLSDRAGNTYDMIRLGLGERVQGQARVGTVFSDAPITDVLVFERPVPGAGELLLDIPADSVKSGTFFRFSTPRSAWATSVAAVPTLPSPQPNQQEPAIRPAPKVTTPPPVAKMPDPVTPPEPPKVEAKPKPSEQPKPEETPKREPPKPEPKEKPKPAGKRITPVGKVPVVVALTPKVLDDYKLADTAEK